MKFNYKSGLLAGLCLYGSLASQGRDLYVREKNGKETVYAIATLNSIQFKKGEMELHTGANTVTRYALEELRHLSFTSLPAASIQESTAPQKIWATLYPNPVATCLQLQYNTAVTESLQFEIWTIDGKKMMSWVLSPSQQPHTIDITPLPPGIYIGRLQSGAQNQTLKFVKQ